MFIEYAISAGEGTLIDFGVAPVEEGSGIHSALAIIFQDLGDVDLTIDGVESMVRFTAASPDCTTGE